MVNSEPKLSADELPSPRKFGKDGQGGLSSICTHVLKLFDPSMLLTFPNI